MRSSLFSIFHCYRGETKVSAVVQKDRKMGLMALARRQIASRGSNAPIEMFITAANHPADPRKEEPPVLYIRYFVSLSARSTALETNCHDKSASVDFSQEARRFQDDGSGFLALITVIRKLARED